jgi:Bacterial mobilisation protein (MobC)
VITAQFIKARVSPETKLLVQTVAQEQLLTESIWLRRVVLRALNDRRHEGRRSAAARGARESQRRRGAKLSVRVPQEDQLLLTERATARAMAPATYVSVLIRAHLRNLSPLPKEELLVLRRAVAELGSIGRNLNQIAKAANQGERGAGLGREEVKTMLRVCEGLRDHVRSLLLANVQSWAQGYVEPGT